MLQRNAIITTLKVLRTLVYFATWWLSFFFVGESVAQLQRMFPEGEELMTIGYLLLLMVSVDAFATNSERRAWAKAFAEFYETPMEAPLLANKLKQLEDDPML